MTQQNTSLRSLANRGVTTGTPRRADLLRMTVMVTVVCLLVFGCPVNLLNVDVDGKSVARVPLRLQTTTRPTTRVSDDETMRRVVNEDDVLDWVVGDLMR